MRYDSRSRCLRYSNRKGDERSTQLAALWLVCYVLYALLH